MTSPDARRLFLALWPDEAVRSALVDLQRRLPPGTGRSIIEDNLHITLVFLGTTSVERQQCVEQGMAGINRPAFAFQLDHLGYWRRPEVLWAGSSLMASPLSALVQDLRDVAARCGCTVDTRPFQTHLTLFRKVRKPPRDLPDMVPIQWPVSSFSLMESVTAAAGVRYNVVQTRALPSSAADSTSG